MPVRLALGLLAVVLAVAIPLLLLPETVEDEPIRNRMPGDVEEVVAAMPPSDLPDQARALLDTDRPWRAARALDRYLEQTPDAPADHKVLAAIAHGGWGDWERVLELLDGIPALESHHDGIGLYLMARARDEAGDAIGAVDAYGAFLAFAPPSGPLEAHRGAARLRLALARIRAGDAEAARRELEELGVVDAPWFRVLRADAHAVTGDTAAVRAAVAGFDEGLLGLRAWRARVEAARQAGDLTRARLVANRARAWARTTDTRAEFLLLAARIALEMGDVAAARDAFRGVIDRSPMGVHARRAAVLLTRFEMVPDDHLAVARVQAAQGLHDEAIDGYRAWLEAGRGTATDRSKVHMDLATALFYAGRYGDVPDALRPIARERRARLLLARAEARRGRVDEAAGIYLDLAADQRGTGMGVEALFLAASVLHDAGEADRARELYRELVRTYPGTDRMGLSLMRLGGMAYLDEEYGDAARLWDTYRARYPRGDRALQAMYWAGRAREQLGDSAAARTLFRSVRQQARDSYYALLATRRLGDEFWPLPMQESPPASASADRRVAAWTFELDLLRNAGFDDAASGLADELAARPGLDRPTRYALAEALAERGYSRRAIRIGLGLQGAGSPDLRLLRILYPFPYRTLITEEARDRDLDPFIAAALIRQESMFETLITSPAGARGLMQIMPPTGRRLAEAAGMAEWDPELLYHPEVNVHLGIRYLAQHMEEYDGSLPSVFSAYNAGTHRVEWWSEFPEYGEDELFAERIPFKETRDYVKILTRNRALYEGLYGGGDADS